MNKEILVTLTKEKVIVRYNKQDFETNHYYYETKPDKITRGILHTEDGKEEVIVYTNPTKREIDKNQNVTIEYKRCYPEVAEMQSKNNL